MHLIYFRGRAHCDHRDGLRGTSSKARIRARGGPKGGGVLPVVDLDETEGDWPGWLVVVVLPGCSAAAGAGGRAVWRAIPRLARGLGGAFLLVAHAGLQGGFCVGFLLDDGGGDVEVVGKMVGGDVELRIAIGDAPGFSPLAFMTVTRVPVVTPMTPLSVVMETGWSR